MKCVYAGNPGPIRTHCRNPQIAMPVLNTQCDTCQLKVEGEPVSAPIGARFPQFDTIGSGVPCIHRGDVVATGSPCCGSPDGPPVHACDVHGECAKTEGEWNKLRRQEIRVKRCDTCRERETE